MERIKEIGTWMAIGAKKMDIVVQFLAEAVLISVTGGFIGIFLGVMAKLIEQIAGIMTIVSFFRFLLHSGFQLLLSYFWLFPGKRASKRSHRIIAV